MDHEGGQMDTDAKSARGHCDWSDGIRGLGARMRMMGGTFELYVPIGRERGKGNSGRDVESAGCVRRV